MPSGPNMNDIARAAGVGKATVSLALRNDPRLRPETRERIQAVARELGYAPNATVAQLMAQLRASRAPKFQATLALLNSSTDPALLDELPTFRSWVKGCRARSSELGYGMDYFWLYEPDISPLRLSQILNSRNIRGLLITGVLHHGSLPDNFAKLWEDYACVTIGVRPSPALHFACNDQYLTAFGTMLELTRRGYTRPGLVLTAQVDQNVDRRFSAGFWAGKNVSEASPKIIPPFDFAADKFENFRVWFAETQARCNRLYP